MDKNESINSIKLSRTFLFVDDDEGACASARRLANIYEVNVQTANTGYSALAHIQNDPEKYFLILTDQFMPGMNGDSLLDQVKTRWPHIRRAMISGDVTSESITKAYDTGEIFRFLSKPADDSSIKQLIEDACLHALSVRGDNENIIKGRQLLLGEQLFEVFKDSPYWKLYSELDNEMLLHCQTMWQTCDISRLPLIEVEQESFKRDLTVSVHKSLVNMRNLLESSEDANHGFTLSAMMRQFNLKGFKPVDRYVSVNEGLFAAFIGKFFTYYELMGVEPKKMFSVQGRSISLDLGDRYFYNDIFNPVLSSVENGIDIVILHLESIMLLMAMRLSVKPEKVDGNIIITLAV